MAQYVVTEDTRVATTGCVFTLKANTPTELTEAQAKAALQFGAVPVSGKPVKAEAEAEEPTEDELREQIKEAIQKILDDGGDLSAEGVPKILEVRKYVKQATPKLRDEVWGTFFNPEKV